MPIARRFATLQALLGDMESEVLAARAMVRSCADLLDAGDTITKEAAASRLGGGGQRVVLTAVGEI